MQHCSSSLAGGTAGAIGALGAIGAACAEDVVSWPIADHADGNEREARVDEQQRNDGRRQGHRPTVVPPVSCRGVGARCSAQRRADAAVEFGHAAAATQGGPCASCQPTREG